MTTMDMLAESKSHRINLLYLQIYLPEISNLRNDRSSTMMIHSNTSIPNWNHPNDESKVLTRKTRHPPHAFSPPTILRMFPIRPPPSQIRTNNNFNRLSMIRVYMHHPTRVLLQPILFPMHRWPQHQPLIHSRFHRLQQVCIHHLIHSLLLTINILLHKCLFVFFEEKKYIYVSKADILLNMYDYLS